MLFNLVRAAVTNAVKAKLLRTYGPILQQSFGQASLGILTSNFVVLQLVSNNLSHISLRHKPAGGSHVKHDKNAGYFFIDAPGCRARLSYVKEKQIIRITSTEVPDACGGRGYGKLLAEEALTWIAKNNYRAKIDCDFVENYAKNTSKFDKFIIK